MTTNRHGTATREFPSELVIVTTRTFDAPMGLVFDVLTKPEYVRQWWATGEDRMTICEVDLRVGGEFHNVLVTPDGTACSFRGAYEAIEPPRFLVNTWLFEGWPDAWATETHELNEVNGITTWKMTMAFRDREGRAHMARALESAVQRGDDNGHDASLDAMEDLLMTLVNSRAES